MTSPFLISAGASLHAILKVAVIILFAGFLVRRKFIEKSVVDGLSGFTIRVLAPCLIFSSILTRFDPASTPMWWAMPLAGAGMNLAGFLGGAALFGLRTAAAREMVALCAIHNAIFLVLPIGQALFPDRFSEFAMTLFLYAIGTSILTWSLGKYLIAPTGGQGFHASDLLTPPLVVTLAGVGLVLAGGRDLIPDLVVDGADLLGQATVPVATFILGATLGSIRLTVLPSLNELTRFTVVKFLFLPLVTIAAITLAGIGGPEALSDDLLIIEAASAPATALILMARTYGGNLDRIGAVILLSYGLCPVFLPLWLGAWNLF